MRVIVVTNMFPTKENPFYGIFVKEQVASLRKEGVSIDVEFINGKENRMNYFTGIFKLIRKLRSTKYDVIHAHHSYCVYLATLAKGIAGMRIPLILTFHEGEIHATSKFEEKQGDFIKRLVLSKKIKEIALNMTDMVIAVQQQLLHPIKFNAKSTVIPCGIDLELFHPIGKEWCRQKLNLPFDKKIIFFPALPEDKQKGIDILKEALTLLGRKDIFLLTAGNILHQDMPMYMCAADVIVQLSRFEASPMVLKEAMAVNIPVVFTDVGDAQLTVGNTKGCYLCERTPEDVALKLEIAINYKSQSEGRKRIIEAGLGLSDIANKIITVYRNTISN